MTRSGSNAGASVRCYSMWLPCWHCIRMVGRVFLDLARLLASSAQSRGALAAENLFLRKQLALFQRTRSYTTTCQRFYALDHGLDESVVRLARCTRDRTAGHTAALASKGFSPVLALEVKADWEAQLTQGPAAVDSPGWLRIIRLGVRSASQTT
jgi:hypothetical protein